MKIARGAAPGGGGGTVSHRVWSIPHGISSTFLSQPTRSVDSARWARLGTTTAAARRSTSPVTGRYIDRRESACWVTTTGVLPARRRQARAASGRGGGGGGVG